MYKNYTETNTQIPLKTKSRGLKQMFYAADTPADVVIASLA